MCAKCCIWRICPYLARKVERTMVKCGIPEKSSQMQFRRVDQILCLSPAALPCLFLDALASLGTIPDICHERHEYIRVNFFGRCKFLQI